MEQKLWDYIIVGTGMGGGPLGLKLAEAGFKVLFLEKGMRPALKGKFAEQFSGEEKDYLAKAGRWQQPIYDHSEKKIKKLWPFLGEGVGGSSALYGMVLERFKENDFKTWPVSYAQMEPYYAKAEALFHVRSSLVIHPANQILSTYFKKVGVPTSPLTLAHEDNPNCQNCQSFLCDQACKNHSGNRCVDVAVGTYGAELITACEVQKILTSGEDVVTGVIAVQKNRSFHLRTRNVILAAGALRTPLLLLDSGLGNESQLVGKNLMRHFVDLYALKIDSAPQIPMTKELGIDLNPGFTLQSFGRLPPAQVIASQMVKELPFLRSVLFFLKVFLKKLTANRITLASILEDQPCVKNRVWKDGDKICIFYQSSEKEKNEIDFSRKIIRKTLKPFKFLFLPSAEKNQMLAHVCGTTKMGLDPKTSVVDQNNKVHGFKNLYVVDASFFPTSGRTNPGLTIAANSLRVADILINSTKEATHVSK